MVRVDARSLRGKQYLDYHVSPPQPLRIASSGGRVTIPQSLSNACFRQPANQAQSRIAAMPVYVSSEKEKKPRAGQTPASGPSPSPQLQSQSIPQAHERTVTRPILAWE